MKNTTKFSVLLLSLVLFQNCTMKEEPLVIGHRGAMGHEVENTLASVQKAMDLGVDMIEIDVFKIKSGEIVVFHDVYLDRLTDTSGKIEDFDFQHLSQVKVAGGNAIPLLNDVLNIIDKKVILNIELKGAGTAEKVDSLVRNFIDQKAGSNKDFIISSFKWDELRTMRRLNSEIPIAILTENDPLEGIPIAQELHAVAINPDFEKLDPTKVQKIKKAGFKIYAWTVNEPSDIEMVKSWAVDGIITNFPERIN
ncbi:MAG: glycerophosphodiester phosphodiesterase [Maribacter sp.]|uniref:glycerophosphodiester phosphodiesterase n=1 Tax=Maribacter sp. TaxID=1897614 RepID=UPI003C77B9F8